MKHIWTCTVVGESDMIDVAADAPMREAVESAFLKVTGVEPKYTFSGFGGKLTITQECVIEGRMLSDEEWRQTPEGMKEEIERLRARIVELEEIK